MNGADTRVTRLAARTPMALTGLLLGAWMTMTGCSSDRVAITAPTPAYRQALARPAPAAPARAQDGLARFAAFFADFTESNVTRQVRHVYAPDAYLRDGFKELHGIDAIAPYMIRSAAAQRSCRFDFEDVVSHGDDHYIRWVMRMTLKRDPPERVDEVIGMTHVRLDAEGRVVFQQDYWDPSDALYSRIPIAGWMINKVKASL